MKASFLLACSQLLTFVLFFSCTRAVYLRHDAVHLAIDSLYIDEIETTDTLEHLPAIYYFCNGKNTTDTLVDLPISKYPGDELRDNCYLLLGPDTIRMHIDAQPLLSIPAKSEKSFWLKTNAFDLIDLMQERNSPSQGNPLKDKSTELEFLRTVIKESIMVLKWNDQTIKVRPGTNVIIRYRDPNNKTID